MKDNLSYIEKISLCNKSLEDQQRILKLFDDNLNLANKIATKYYKTKYWDYEESIQIARFGLFKACLIWDPDKYRLSTLAYNIINRDFMDFDKQQKKQPSILFNLEDTIVTDNLSLNDVLVDENTNIIQDFEDKEYLKELKENIIDILEIISENLNIPVGIVKLIYIVNLEVNINEDIKKKSLSFIKKDIIDAVMSQLRLELEDLL